MSAHEAERPEIQDILRTLREVGESLDRRAARAEGVNLVIWGFAAALIFAFYQLATWNPDPYAAALGGALHWVWIAPMAVAYAASMMVGARLGRLGVDAARRRALQYCAIPALVIALVVTSLILTDRDDAIYGGVTIVGGIANLAFGWPAPPGVARTSSLAVGATLVAIGIGILLWQGALASGVAALAFLLGYGLLGTVKYLLGR